jgi:3-oxoacyl-ACP reductase-like protein
VAFETAAPESTSALSERFEGLDPMRRHVCLVESIDQFGEVRMPTVFDFRGRVAVGTGGAQGIGRAIAKRLLHGGATAWLWDRDIALARAAAAEMGSIGEALAVCPTWRRSKPPPQRSMAAGSTSL